MRRYQNPRRVALALFVLLLAMLSIFPIAAESLATRGLSRFVLANGLELFVYENHTVPLAKIQIVFRCGSISQSPKTAGLFHLYEHMLFKGNEVYQTQSDFQAAMKALGVASWNGGTGNELVAYHFTVPSQKVGEGVAFWANAVRYPLFDPVELETEKKVVINEIRGYLNNPDDIFRAGMDRRLYYEYPWRRDASGNEQNIANATVAMMKSIQHAYYVPDNAAVFVGGDVDPQRVLEVVERSFGSWKRSEGVSRAPLQAHPAPLRDRFLTFADEQMYGGVVRVTLRFRGPDVLRDSEATYAADVWGTLMDDPDARFRSALEKKVPGLYNRDYIWAFYYTQRDGGYIEFTTYLLRRPSTSTYARVRALVKAIRSELVAMAEDTSYFPPADFDLLKVKLADEKIIESETADRLIASLSFWWASANTEYYLTYVDHLRAVSQSDIARFIRSYLIGAHAVVGVRINPAELDADEASRLGFELLDRTNAFWWSRAKEEDPR